MAAHRVEQQSFAADSERLAETTLDAARIAEVVPVSVHQLRVGESAAVHQPGLSAEDDEVPAGLHVQDVEDCHVELSVVVDAEDHLAVFPVVGGGDRVQLGQHSQVFPAADLCDSPALHGVVGSEEAVSAVATQDVAVARVVRLRSHLEDQLAPQSSDAAGQLPACPLAPVDMRHEEIQLARAAAVCHVL